jgi:hypothetical protein
VGRGALGLVMGAVLCVAGAARAQDCPGTPEICNGIDDDCNLIPDDGLGPGASCIRDFDRGLYPGDRSRGVCRPGRLSCVNGREVCLGGVTPFAEVCNGEDDDCDGVTDEPGPSPDGIDGSFEQGNPGRKLGDACGSATGDCRPGRYVCVTGAFRCAGGIGPQPELCDGPQVLHPNELSETCNGKDDDCDGIRDDGVCP